MGFTDKFRTQHDEILQLAGEITEQLKRKDMDAAVVRKQLSNLAGKVNFHLAMEDKALYPRLIERKGTRAETTATKFQTEMGGLAQVFTEYNNKWQLSAIRADAAGFGNETRKVFGALAHRIARETSELYPLADQAS
ncbi:MAG TPA: hemerythrin domain-containing protein [Ramlibacter sp.]|nr:hemerythrin domain-containing protein [Ramlibacter sp.]